MGRPIAAHYGPDWAKLYRETATMMQYAFGTTGDVLFLFCSGGGAVEAAIGSLFAPGEEVLIVNNGFFGQRLMMIAEALGLVGVPVTAAWGRPVDLTAVRQTLTNNKAIKGILSVHHDTGTGRLNPVAELGAIAREFDIPLMVDAVASTGGDPLLVDEWGIDVCVTAGNKCLGAPVGLAPIAVSPRAWAVMEQKEKTAVGWYLNLRTWRKAVQEGGDWHPSPVTVSSHTMLGLHVALHKLCEEGLEERWRRYKETAEWFRGAIKERGWELFVEGNDASSVITAVQCPADINAVDFINTLREEYQIQISNGLGELRDKVLRIGHMGDARNNIIALLAALDSLTAKSNGHI
jgi:alanine-glyoxylate transaminase/serine-glyoxylate transaminase/serine-pyruvate transaminase